MALKHRITINVTDPHGNTGTVLKGADVRLPARLIRFLFGDFTQVYLLKAVLSKDVKNRISKESTDVIKAVGKKVAASIDQYIDEVKKQADDKDVLRPEPAKNASKKEPVIYKFDVPSAAKKPVANARPLGVPSPVTGIIIRILAIYL